MATSHRKQKSVCHTSPIARGLRSLPCPALLPSMSVYGDRDSRSQVPGDIQQAYLAQRSDHLVIAQCTCALKRPPLQPLAPNNRNSARSIPRFLPSSRRE
ncbi:hypothetical protein BRAS3843_2750029 [Bradyrhizobium sp. STM 3843]|nr:hypothetical protein BRAS3843_2750029 [Bradyrhizobium sp. STM 3843]